MRDNAARQQRRVAGGPARPVRRDPRPRDDTAAHCPLSRAMGCIAPQTARGDICRARAATRGGDRCAGAGRAADPRVRMLALTGMRASACCRRCGRARSRRLLLGFGGRFAPLRAPHASSVRCARAPPAPAPPDALPAAPRHPRPRRVAAARPRAHIARTVPAAGTRVAGVLAPAAGAGPLQPQPGEGQLRCGNDRQLEEGAEPPHRQECAAGESGHARVYGGIRARAGPAPRRPWSRAARPGRAHSERACAYRPGGPLTGPVGFRSCRCWSAWSTAAVADAK